MALFVREIEPDENERLSQFMIGDCPKTKHRAKVVLLSARGFSVPEIAKITEAHATNLRKWVHRFNQRGPDGLISPTGNGPPPRFSEEQKNQIAETAQQSPRSLGLEFTRWTLHKLAEYASQAGIVESISHVFVRQVLIKQGVDYGKLWRVNPNVEVV